MERLLYEHQGSWDSPEVVTAIRTIFVDIDEAGCFGSDVNAISPDDANSLFYSG